MPFAVHPSTALYRVLKSARLVFQNQFMSMSDVAEKRIA